MILEISREVRRTERDISKIIVYSLVFFSRENKVFVIVIVTYDLMILTKICCFMVNRIQLLNNILKRASSRFLTQPIFMSFPLVVYL